MHLTLSRFPVANLARAPKGKVSTLAALSPDHAFAAGPEQGGPRCSEPEAFMPVVYARDNPASIGCRVRGQIRLLDLEG